MEEIKCAGINEKGLPTQQFHQLFQQYCQREGRIVMFAGNNRFAAALVIK